MELSRSEFVGSYPKLEQAPTDGLPEFAFIGRSNVGKSSLVNLITDRRELARISNTPGKTQHLNYYRIDDRWYLVDLPGYGYAQVSKKLRRSFQQMIERYLKARKTLVNAFVLIDSHIPPQRVDLEFCNWLGEQQIPFLLVFTKTDRQPMAETNEQVAAFQQKMREQWEQLPPHFLTSSVRRTGREEVLHFISQTLDSIGC